MTTETDHIDTSAEAIVSAAKLASMTPRELHPFEQDALAEALATIDRFGTFTPEGLQYRTAYSLDDLAAAYVASLPRSARVRQSDAERAVRKAMIDTMTDRALNIARVVISTDPDDRFDPSEDRARLPHLVWHATPVGGLADKRGEIAWCVLYFPNAYKPEATAENPAPDYRAGYYDKRGVGQVVKVYTTASLDDPEDDARDLAAALATVRRISRDLCMAPETDEPEQSERQPRHPVI